MKKVSILFFLHLIFVGKFTLLAQTKVDDVFDSSVPMTFIGIDFSEVKFIGPAAGWGEVSTKSSSEMRDNYFPAWNNLIIHEVSNFKIEEAVARKIVDRTPSVVESVNHAANKKEIFSESQQDYQLLNEDMVKKMAKKYDLKGKKGIAFVLIAEGMNKPLEEASYWATFIDMGTNKVLYTKRVIGKAGGFGFRNYWAGSIKNVFKYMKKEFKHWD